MRRAGHIMRDMFAGYGRPRISNEEKRRHHIALRNKHMPQICKILGLEFRPMDENGNLTTNNRR